MLPILNIGPLALPAPALILLVGFWIALDITEKQAELFGASPRHIYNLILTAIVAGLVGARLVYALQTPQAFIDSPLSFLSPRPEMLDATGGLVIAVLGALIYGWSRRLALWPTLDALTSLLAVLAVTLGVSHFASGVAFGAPAQLPWSIELWGELRHPSQVYETLAAMLITALVWPGSRIARRCKTSPGLRFWAFLAFSAAARLILETFRGDSTLALNIFREAQVIAWVVLAVSLWQIGVRINRTASPAANPVDPAPESVEQS